MFQDYYLGRLCQSLDLHFNSTFEISPLQAATPFLAPRLEWEPVDNQVLMSQVYLCGS